VSGERLAVGFTRMLRRAGLEVPVGSVVTFVDALGALGVQTRSAVYWAGRASLVHDRAEIEVYDRVFAAFWDAVEGEALTELDEASQALVLLDAEPEASAVGSPAAESAVALRYSAIEVLRAKDFAAYSRDEHDEARRLIADLRLAGALRPGRRARSVRQRAGRPDLRRTVRQALRTGGEPLRRSWVAPAERPRKVVVVCDISGSMEPYARALMRFVQAAVAASGHVEAFALGTRLTRLTRELRSRDPDAALAAASRAVADWSGGTRLGEGLRTFNDRWGIRGLARGAVVVIMSDGWDRGDPDLLTEQMARLRRVAHRIIWVNPLKSSPGYAPLARGMAAALPYVDAFVEGHSLAALESLAEVISR
jgi:uncharacterized protein with von Willebrand factor type A (vWA) domain